MVNRVLDRRRRNRRSLRLFVRQGSVSVSTIVCIRTIERVSIYHEYKRRTRDPIRVDTIDTTSGRCWIHMIIEGTPMDMSHSARGHILGRIHMPAGRVFTNPRLLQVKRMLAYCTKEATTYIGDISTRPKLRNNSRCVVLKRTHSILRYCPTDPRTLA